MIAVKAIHAATDFAVGLNFKIMMPDMTIPTPMTNIPPIAAIRLASCAAKLNWVSIYLGRNVYRPATGSKCSTDEAVRNMRISLLNWRFIVLGKSELSAAISGVFLSIYRSDEKLVTYL